MLRRFGGAPAGRSDGFPDVLRHDRQLVGRVVELLRRARMEPEDGRRGVRCADRIDVGDDGSGGRAKCGILGASYGEAHVVGANWLSVVPPGVRVEMERDAQRILRPGPAIGQPRCKAPITDDVERVANVREPVVDQVDDLPGGSRLQKGWDEDVGVTAGRHGERAAGATCRRLGSNASAHEGCAKDPTVSQRRHVQSSSRKWGTRSSTSPQISSSASSAASESSKARTASNIAAATSTGAGARPSNDSNVAGTGIDSRAPVAAAAKSGSDD